MLYWVIPHLSPISPGISWAKKLIPTPIAARMYPTGAAQSVGRSCHQRPPHPRVLCRADETCSNIVRRRPPDNRTPTAEELKFYVPILLEEIGLVDPDIIVTLGTSIFFVFFTGCIGKGGDV